ncbi:DUF655 domain-containing protein [Candidatus Micrarchaeota archaeon]|nr:DUF655 domain-containing protein [Candidatus Micrarchaeota archaeon]
MVREEYAIVLDFLPSGYADSYRKEAVAQALGESFFSILELIPKPDSKLDPRERVYIGGEKRDKILLIRGRVLYDRLTATARNELRAVIEDLIRKNEPRFVDFFNRAGPISVRQHSLELIPGIGKKHMIDIVDEREKGQFQSFADMAARVKLLPDPVRVLTDRIVEELEGKSKYYMFARPPREEFADRR